MRLALDESETLSESTKDERIGPSSSSFSGRLLIVYCLTLKVERIAISFGMSRGSNQHRGLLPVCTSVGVTKHLSPA